MGMGYDVGFGIAAGLGVLTADLIGKHIHHSHHGNVITKNIEERVMEIGLSTGAGLLAKRYVVGQDIYNPVQTSAIIITADVLGDYIAHTIYG